MKVVMTKNGTPSEKKHMLRLQIRKGVYKNIHCGLPKSTASAISRNLTDAIEELIQEGIIVVA